MTPAFDRILIKADDEDKTGQVEEELHRFQEVKFVGREAAVQVINEHHDAGYTTCGKLLKSSFQLLERCNVERLRVLRFTRVR